VSIIVKYEMIGGIDYTHPRAIDMLPHMLATIGESLVNQTGWNVTILTGGPMPDTDGRILTYLYVNFL